MPIDRPSRGGREATHEDRSDPADAEGAQPDAATKAPRAGDREIGLRIRQARIRAGASQQEVARRIGVSPQQFQKYERGANRLPSGRLLDVACALRLPVTAFLEAQAPASGPAPAIDAMLGDRSGRRVIRAWPRLSETVRLRLGRLAQELARHE